jgi:hypothetical protein
MGDAHRAAVRADEDGLGIDQAAGTRGGIAVMAYGDMAGEVGERILRKNVGDAPHAGENPYFLTIGRGDTRAFLAAVLQGEECKKGKAGYIYIRGINAKDSASFVQD